MKKECIFCNSIEGKRQSYKVVDSPKVIGFLDIDPVTPSHTLLVPRKHVKDLYDLTSVEFAEVAEQAKKSCRSLEKEVQV